MTREKVLADARARMTRNRRGRVWVGGLIKREAHLDMVYIQQEWGVKTNIAALELALQYLAQSTRDGLIHPGVPGYEHLAPR